jgi:hypothetical protein
MGGWIRLFAVSFTTTEVFSTTSNVTNMTPPNPIPECRRHHKMKCQRWCSRPALHPIVSKGSSDPEKAWPHERRCAEEDVAAAEAALGAGKDETTGEHQTNPDLQASAVCEPSSTEEDGGCTACSVGEGEGATASLEEGDLADTACGNRCHLTCFSPNTSVPVRIPNCALHA